MNEDFEQRQPQKKRINTGKEIAFIAVFVALTIGAQFALSALPGVEIVTLLFVSYSFTFGVKRGMLAATAFSLIRQLVFGFYANVLVLYLLYYNVLAAVFGLLGYHGKAERRWLAACILSCVCTVGFSLLDFFLTAFIGGYSEKAKEIYFTASLPVMITQAVCAVVTVGVLFVPLCKIFSFAKKKI